MSTGASDKPPSWRRWADATSVGHVGRDDPVRVACVSLPSMRLLPFRGAQCLVESYSKVGTLRPASNDVRFFIWLEIPSSSRAVKVSRRNTLRSQPLTIYGMRAGDRIVYRPSLVPLGNPQAWLFRDGVWQLLPRPTDRSLTRHC